MFAIKDVGYKEVSPWQVLSLNGDNSNNDIKHDKVLNDILDDNIWKFCVILGRKLTIETPEQRAKSVQVKQ